MSHSPTPCGCGRSWPTVEAKRAELEPVGVMDFDGYRLEIGTCPCGSTITIERRCAPVQLTQRDATTVEARRQLDAAVKADREEHTALTASYRQRCWLRWRRASGAESGEAVSL